MFKYSHNTHLEIPKDKHAINPPPRRPTPGPALPPVTVSLSVVGLPSPVIPFVITLGAERGPVAAFPDNDIIHYHIIHFKTNIIVMKID